MAEAYAMVTGHPGFCLSTLGPGSTALVNGVAAATWDRVPLVAISGQVETSRKQFFTHQVVDHKLLFSPVAKWAGRLESESVGTIMRKALRTAVAERPGAVHLTGPANTFTAAAADAAVVMPPLNAAVSTVTVSQTVGCADPSEQLLRARRPLLLAGYAATRCGASAALMRAAETIGMPVVTSPMSKGVFPEDHPYFAGVLDMACNQVMWRLLEDSDLIVAAGFDPVELIKPWRLTTPVEAMAPRRRAARVRLTDHGGDRLERLRLTRKGDPDDPLSDSELRAKYDELVVPFLGEQRAASIARTLWDLPCLERVRGLDWG
jgi:acetolactate synthase-1/2/3 large subunit